MAREATDGDLPSLGDELDLVVDIIRLYNYNYVTMNDVEDDGDATTASRQIPTSQLLGTLNFIIK